MDNDVAIALPDVDAVTDDVPVESAYSLLADRTRRRLLCSLGQLDTPEKLSALTRTIAMAREDAESVDTEWIRARLHHVHVPKLEAAGFLRYDREERTARLTSDGESVARALMS